MTITNAPPDPGAVVHCAKCRGCRCQFTFQRIEARAITHPARLLAIHCPNCREEVLIDPDKQKEGGNTVF